MDVSFAISVSFLLSPIAAGVPLCMLNAQSTAHYRFSYSGSVLSSESSGSVCFTNNPGTHSLAMVASPNALTCYTIGLNFVTSRNQYFPRTVSDGSHSSCCYAEDVLLHGRWRKPLHT